ncbi:MAG: cyclic pyranopterin monophosphate synthase MoaC [Gemmatimonadaceae bacterium]|nr:cyclic pyranopterin monophosphate synthase MoaC [Gemmatimonadaceae bacterium]NUO95472.1 cyclic pyranopterin monophosphate synthase MoaC [Gemmatimonadaceae bacterium]NUP55019.1 cyclic pyranopterin monophosphate synthase MoaC [Gemmatimonadaceae bacterium]NUP71380.1 cyclic pyranopterin monophosphate synthase MoaC [Gemmatimonadaceae bacterium]NUR36416.1 cyclic pyranopterin monophosphate synthase MoaC [Gemmatimonadaceae bacterium]
MSDGPAGRLSHVTPDGTARMVDVGGKPETARMARATGRIIMTRATLEAIVGNTLAKGDVLGVARVAGIMAAKRTAELIPLCHPLPLTDVRVEFVTDSALPGVRVEAVVRTVGRTGVEMEALAGATIALLTVYDMTKAMDKSMVINDIALAEKTGGAGGPYARP